MIFLSLQKPAGQLKIPGGTVLHKPACWLHKPPAVLGVPLGLGLMAMLMLTVAAAAAAAAACVCTGNRVADSPCCSEGRAVVPNRLEGAPLRGWNSWQAFASDVDQTVLEDVMRRLAKTRGLPGGFRSLADAGYADVGLDWGYGNHLHTNIPHTRCTRTPPLAAA